MEGPTLFSSRDLRYHESPVVMASSTILNGKFQLKRCNLYRIRETLFLLDSFSLPVKFGIGFFSPNFLDEMKQESTLCTLPEVYNGSPLKNDRIQRGKQLSIHFSGANSLVKLRGCKHPGKLTLQWKMDPWKMYFLWKMVVFHCYVSLPKGIISNFLFSIP